MWNDVLDILKYTLPAIIVLISSYMIINTYLVKEVEKKQLAIFKENVHITIQMRMQAYERLTIFLERMRTPALISRYYNQNMTVQDLQIAIVQGIRSEFEHNYSQQIYVSPQVWNTVKTAMEQEITMLNRIGSTFELGAPSSAYVKRVTDFTMNSETTLPIDIALEVINTEAKKLLTTIA